MYHFSPPNPALNPVRFALWTLRDKAAQRRLALRWATQSAMFRSATVANHRASSASTAAVLLGSAGRLPLSYYRPCGAPPLGGSLLSGFGRPSAPAVLAAPLYPCRMSVLSLATAVFSVLAGATTALRSGVASLFLSPLARSRFSFVRHTPSPNPAVNRTPNKRGVFCSTHLARRPLLLR